MATPTIQEMKNALTNAHKKDRPTLVIVWREVTGHGTPIQYMDASKFAEELEKQSDNNKIHELYHTYIATTMSVFDTPNDDQPPPKKPAKKAHNKDDEKQPRDDDQEEEPPQKDDRHLTWDDLQSDEDPEPPQEEDDRRLTWDDLQPAEDQEPYQEDNRTLTWDDIAQAEAERKHEAMPWILDEICKCKKSIYHLRKADHENDQLLDMSEYNYEITKEERYILKHEKHRISSKLRFMKSYLFKLERAEKELQNLQGFGYYPSQERFTITNTTEAIVFKDSENNEVLIIEIHRETDFDNNSMTDSDDEEERQEAIKAEEEARRQAEIAEKEAEQRKMKKKADEEERQRIAAENARCKKEAEKRRLQKMMVTMKYVNLPDSMVLGKATKEHIFKAIEWIGELHLLFNLKKKSSKIELIELIETFGMTVRIIRALQGVEEAPPKKPTQPKPQEHVDEEEKEVLPKKKPAQKK